MKHGLIRYHQGMLLKPQHFQIETKLREDHIARIAKVLQPWFYGVNRLALNQDALSAKTILVASGAFLFSDGSYAHIGDNAVCLPRMIPDEALGQSDVLSVYVGIRRFSEKSSNVTRYQGEPPQDCPTRYICSYTGVNMPDLYGEGLDCHVELLQYNVRIFLESELDYASDYELLKIAEVYQDGSKLVSNQNYVPPVFNFFGHSKLVNSLNNISLMVLSKTAVFEKYKHLRRNSKLSSYEIMLVSLISSLARASAEIQMLSESDVAHPWEVWKTLAGIEASLSAYCDELSSIDEQRKFPDYDHENLAYVFATLEDHIRLCMNSLTVGPEHIIKFTRGEQNVWTASVPDLSSMNRCKVFLSISGEGLDPDKLSLSFWKQLKFSSAHALPELISRSLPGITVSIADNIPGSLPSLDSGFYSLVDTKNELWNDLVDQKEAAILWNGPTDANITMYVTSEQ